MGRKIKYHTEEERLQAKRERWSRWYDKNKQSLNEKRMKDYYELQKNSQSNNRES